MFTHLELEHLEDRITPSVFGPAATFPLGDPDLYVASMAVVDFNHDSHLDVAALHRSGSRSVSILLGDGQGGLDLQPGFLSTGAFSAAEIVAADFDGDGNVDLATANGDIIARPGLGVSVFMGDGRGGFTRTQSSPFDSGDDEAFHLVAADFDRDGKLDIVTSNSNSGSVSVLLGDGAGGFVIAGGPVNVPGGAGALAAGDFNRDGNQDIVITSDGTVALLVGDGLGGLQDTGLRLPVFWLGGDPQNLISTIAAADFNRDGNLDVASASAVSGGMTVYLGDGDGGFSLAPGSPHIQSQGINSIAVADVNIDGRLDIVAAGTQSIVVFTGDGLGGFGAMSAIAAVSYEIKIGDFNEDGLPDLVVSRASGASISIFLNQFETSENVDGVPLGGQAEPDQFNALFITMLEELANGQEENAQTPGVMAYIASAANPFVTISLGTPYGTLSLSAWRSGGGDTFTMEGALDGQPGQTIILEYQLPNGTWTPAGQATTDQQGRYQFQGLPSGTYRVRVQASPKAMILPLPPAEPIDLVFEDGWECDRLPQLAAAVSALSFAWMEPAPKRSRIRCPRPVAV